MREGNNILGVYACDSDRPPVAIRYLVDPDVPGAEIIVDRGGKRYTVWWPCLVNLVDVSLSDPPYRRYYYVHSTYTEGHRSHYVYCTSSINSSPVCHLHACRSDLQVVQLEIRHTFFCDKMSKGQT